MSLYLLIDFATQSIAVVTIDSVSIGGRSMALLITSDRAGVGLVTVAGFRPSSYHLLTGATRCFSQADGNGEAQIVMQPDAPVAIMLVAMI